MSAGAPAGKWLEALKEISPRVKRVAFLLHPEHPAWAGYLRTVKEAASSFDVEVIPAGIRDAGEIEHVIDSFAREPNGGNNTTQKMPDSKDDPKSSEWRPYMFARDQWHCRICGDRFLYSEMVRKHIANEHDEAMPPSIYEYFQCAVWQRMKLP